MRGEYWLDEAKILVKGGRGGDGCISFRRERGVEKGGPDGGDGGKGGDVKLIAKEYLKTFSHLKRRTLFKAGNGEHGKGKGKHGKKGEDLYIEVPVGTCVYKLNDSSSEEKLLVDLSEKNQEVLVAEGGKGGKGNIHFKSSIKRTPRFAKKGEKGEVAKILIKLYLLADIGIIGYPNVGKSTLLSRISRAYPKIAPYPFTTLTPNLGIITHPYTNFQLTVADLPGIIEGAHKGKGLGINFLKHIERTSILVHVLDATDSNPEKNFHTLFEELRLYGRGLENKPQIIVFNKIDLISSLDNLDKIKERIAGFSYFQPIYISALLGWGIEELISRLWEYFKR